MDEKSFIEKFNEELKTKSPCYDCKWYVYIPADPDDPNHEKDVPYNYCKLTTEEMYCPTDYNGHCPLEDGAHQIW